MGDILCSYRPPRFPWGHQRKELRSSLRAPTRYFATRKCAPSTRDGPSPRFLLTCWSSAYMPAAIVRSATWKRRHNVLEDERVRVEDLSSVRRQVHHHADHLIFTPRAVKDTSAGWIDFGNGVISSDEIREAFRGIIHVARVGCVEVARQICAGDCRLPPRTAPFRLQDYILELSVEQRPPRQPKDDSDDATYVTTAHLDFGYAMAYPCYECKSFRPNGSSILDTLRYNPKCPEPFVPLEILSCLNKARIIRAFSKECQVGLEAGTYVLAVHNTRPLVEGTASIERMVFTNTAARVQSSPKARKRSRSTTVGHRRKESLFMMDTPRAQSRAAKRFKRALEFETP